MSNVMTKQNGQQRGQAPARAETGRLAVRPRVDVFENDAEYLVVADVPGVTKDAIDVRFEEGELRLEARRAAAAPAQDTRALAEEYRAADFRRAFAMPEGVDAEKIDAELANGVLRLHLPKSAARRPRRIDIRAS
jgi:HSP20 family molecular chaperone IbpA